MDQPHAVAFTAFADAWPSAIETEIGAALCAIGAGKDFNIFDLPSQSEKFVFSSDNIFTSF